MPESLVIPKDITNNPAWNAAVVRAVGWVADTLGRWDATKRLAWGVGGDPRKPVFTLRMAGEGEAITGEFDWPTLTDQKGFKDRVYKMWVDLVSQVIHTQVEELKQMRDEWRKEAVVGA